MKHRSRWENGKGYPSGLVNKLLRLLDEGHLTLADLSAVEGPRRSNSFSSQNIERIRQFLAADAADDSVQPLYCDNDPDNIISLPISA